MISLSVRTGRLLQRRPSQMAVGFCFSNPTKVTRLSFPSGQPTSRAGYAFFHHSTLLAVRIERRGTVCDYSSRLVEIEQISAMGLLVLYH